MIRSASEFGILVRARRKERGWTQAQLAKRCGTGERFIVELENEKPGYQLEKALSAVRTVRIDLVDRSVETSDHPTEIDDDLAHLPRFP
ncbi:transcriptional regulator (plasmid) [Rhizobium ruizarguesonis]|uniref:helix-turn-helix domain-containing protein n=1 Tax=Rhizobium ruizarguesonis TaxID=2081791 RepID=UPI001030F6AA|nr:helix-turn-helix domain-containing protein [Rhizobium ruizarguesonis]TAZ71094.1 transcriptional regulator [Rhizobium ruizarguesonis]